MRLIDADELIKEISSHCYLVRQENNSIEPGMTWMGILQAIQEQPTIEERKKGKWIDEGVYADGHGAHVFRCSECGGHIIEYDANPFCKWCGTDMRKEEMSE